MRDMTEKPVGLSHFKSRKNIVNRNKNPTKCKYINRYKCQSEVHVNLVPQIKSHFIDIYKVKEHLCTSSRNFRKINPSHTVRAELCLNLII